MKTYYIWEVTLYTTYMELDNISEMYKWYGPYASLNGMGKRYNLGVF